ncbi:MAG: AAA family ATPase [Deltaproteobacteria bacterium]|jgi:flagellar biosynthesis protein FlhG
MREKAENLETHRTKQAPDKKVGASKGSGKVCVFPAQIESDTQIAKATAKKLGIPFVDPLRAHIEPSAVALLKPEIAFSRQALPIRLVNDILLVAMATPEQPMAIRSLEILTGCKIRPAAAPKSSLSVALQKTYEQPSKSANEGRLEAFKRTQKKKAGARKTGALTVSVVSNKGGVGKTHFSINLACALAKTGAKVLLIDADLGNADISTKLGVFSKYHLLHFLQKDQDMKRIIIPTSFHFDLICGTYGEFKLANLYYAQKVKFIKHFEKTSAGYDFVVFDLGAGIARTVLDFALGSDHTVIVTTPQDLISGYACAKAAFFRYREIEQKLEERLTEYTPEFTFSPMLVINQVNDFQQGVKIYNRIERIVDKNLNASEGRFRLKLEYLGSMPYDRKSLRTAEQNMRPFLLDSPYVKVSQCIQHISTRFCNPENRYDTRLKFRHSLKRFVAILTQKI